MKKNNLFLLITGSHHLWANMLRENLRINSLGKHSVLSLSIVHYIVKHNASEQKTICKSLGRDAMSVSQAVRILQKKSLITSMPTEDDKRVRLLQLTQKGEELAESIISLEKELINKFIDSQGNQQYDSLSEGVKALYDQIKPI